MTPHLIIVLIIFNTLAFGLCFLFVKSIKSKEKKYHKLIEAIFKESPYKIKFRDKNCKIYNNYNCNIVEEEHNNTIQKYIIIDID